MENKKTKNVKKYKTKNVIKLNLIKHIFLFQFLENKKKSNFQKCFCFLFFLFFNNRKPKW